VTDSNVPIGGSAALATSLSLLERAKASDRPAWDRIVYLYAPLVYAWCRRFGLQDADALDVGQEVLRSVFTKLPDFRKDRPGDSFRKWLKTITRNRALDLFRRKSRQPIALDSEHAAPDESPEPAEELTEQKVVLRRALDLVRDDFEPRTWTAFWRVTIDEAPPADVAQELGVSVNVVYLARSRVLRRLADQFAELIDGWQSR
jgi:RNA polymerase sigma-70 factor, ECF subfamily